MKLLIISFNYKIYLDICRIKNKKDFACKIRILLKVLFRQRSRSNAFQK